MAMTREERIGLCEEYNNWRDGKSEPDDLEKAFKFADRLSAALYETSRTLPDGDCPYCKGTGRLLHSIYKNGVELQRGSTCHECSSSHKILAIFKEVTETPAKIVPLKEAWESTRLSTMMANQVFRAIRISMPTSQEPTKETLSIMHEILGTDL